jgi:hypothetical protein
MKKKKKKFTNIGTKKVTHLVEMIFVPVGEPDAELVHVGPVALLADDGLAGERPVLVHQQLRVLAQMAGGGQRRRCRLRIKGQFLGRFADPHNLNADPDPDFHCNVDPDPDFHFNVDPDPLDFHFNVDPDPDFQYDVDPDPDFHFNVDPDPDFHYNVDPNTAFHFNVYPDPAFHLNVDPDPDFHLNVDPDPGFSL